MMVSSELPKAHEDDGVGMAWPPCPHRPFTVSCKANVQEARQLVFRQAKALPKEGPFGPEREGPSWTVARALADAAAGGVCW